MRFTTDSSPIRKAHAQSLTALLLGAILITPIAGAQADEDAPPKLDSEKLKRQILSSLDHPELALQSPDDASQTSSKNGFRLSKKGPIQYRQIFQVGSDEVSVKLYGPVVRKKPGLRFRVEGLRIGDHPVNLEGFGNSKEGGCRFTIRY